ncbi:MAG TPA: hypothetical protein VFQ39_05675 [Longimicrobium sp.]|nr:hypothetical protein [Longimicrobium sp.]
MTASRATALRGEEEDESNGDDGVTGDTLREESASLPASFRWIASAADGAAAIGTESARGTEMGDAPSARMERLGSTERWVSVRASAEAVGSTLARGASTGAVPVVADASAAGAIGSVARCTTSGAAGGAVAEGDASAVETSPPAVAEIGADPGLSAPPISGPMAGRIGSPAAVKRGWTDESDGGAGEMPPCATVLPESSCGDEDAAGDSPRDESSSRPPSFRWITPAAPDGMAASDDEAAG